VDQAIRLEPRDDNGNLVEKLTIEPPLMNVVIEIEQTTFSRPVTVSPDVTGVPADGYNIVSVSANPAIVVIRGEQASIGEMTTISTQPVDVEGKIRTSCGASRCNCRRASP
jgi:YbbR domain-containing protein